MVMTFVSAARSVVARQFDQAHIAAADCTAMEQHDVDLTEATSPPTASRP